MTELISKQLSPKSPRPWHFAVAGALLTLSLCTSADAVVVGDPAASAAAPITLERPLAPVRSIDFTRENAELPAHALRLAGASVAFGMGLAGSVKAEDGTLFKRAAMLLGTGIQERSGRYLASIAAGPYEPVAANVADLATFGSNTRSNVLNIPSPGALPTGTTPKDSIPEPGAIGFGLAVFALILGNGAKAFLRCWRMTSVSFERDRS